MQSKSSPKLRIAICGGGIGGLTLANALVSPSVHIDVYEAASQFGEIGAGVGLSLRTLRVYEMMGLKEGLESIGGKQPEKTAHLPFRCYRAHTGVAEPFKPPYVGAGPVTVHRAELHNMLFRKLPEAVHVHTAKRLVSYFHPNDPASPVTLRFADDTDATCDVLIGADGIKSVVRAGMLEELARCAEGAGNTREAAELRVNIPPRYSGCTTYRAMYRMSDKTRDISPSQDSAPGELYVGKNRMIIAYPVSQGSARLINVAGTSINPSRAGELHPEPWVAEVDPAEMIEGYRGWAPEVQEILQAVKLEGGHVKKWVVNVVGPLSAFAHGRVALLGDAASAPLAHGMTHFHGAGAGQAVEDAYMLRELLLDPRTTAANAQQALQVYSRLRAPIAEFVQKASYENGLVYSGRPLEGELEKTQVAMAAFVSEDPVEDAKKALAMLYGARL
ncbi:salicylate hydroxylase [Vararia minispora EC-137]|uniref:Salicylate hydroxylase n=1 Tax=Vararia minispora EC-137 TaxID=1314806 RepID=A0ACB8QFU9_9AGAM|nr:salicylate hydroxylase [Vararia minispora EC-137]